MDITGKVAVVTGAGQGLGRAYAIALAEAGAAVVVNDVNAETAGAVVDTINAAGGRAVAEPVPVGTTEAAEQLVLRALQAFGRLDVMVTNAGVLRDRVLWNMSDEVRRVHQRRGAARPGAVEHERRRLRHRRPGAPARHLHLRPRGGQAVPAPGRGRPADPGRLAGRPARQLRPDQLRRREGRHRGDGPHLGDGAGPGRSHGQRRRPERRHRDDRDDPVPRAVRRADGAGACRSRRWSAGPRRSAPPRTSPD